MHVFGKLERKISCEMDAHALSVCRNFEAGVLIRSEYRFWKTVKSLLCVVSRSWIMCIKGFVMCIPMIETVHKIGFMISISKNALLRMEWWSHHLWYFDTYQDNPWCYLWDAQMRITIKKVDWSGDLWMIRIHFPMVKEVFKMWLSVPQFGRKVFIDERG